MRNLIKLPKLFILCLVMLSLSSCSNRVADYEIKWAETACEAKGGLRYIKTEGIGRMGCMCQNGEFEYSD